MKVTVYNLISKKETEIIETVYRISMSKNHYFIHTVEGIKKVSIKEHKIILEGCQD